MGRLLITGGRIICPAQGLDRVTSLLIENGTDRRTGSCGPLATTKSSTPAANRRAGADRYAYATSRAGLRRGRNDRDRHARRRWPAAIRRSPACRRPIRRIDTPAAVEFVRQTGGPLRRTATCSSSAVSARTAKAKSWRRSARSSRPGRSLSATACGRSKTRICCGGPSNTA